jgi:hypothetical protein
VIDVLRDYRFYDVDLAHPNYAATQFVLEKFSDYAFDTTTKTLLEEIKKIVIAKKHKAFNPQSALHKKFLQQHVEKTQLLLQAHPYLDLKDELKYFLDGQKNI